MDSKAELEILSQSLHECNSINHLTMIFVKSNFLVTFCSHTEEVGVGGMEEDGEAGVTPVEGGEVGVTVVGETHIITIIITTLAAGVAEGVEEAGSQEGVAPPLEEEAAAAGSPQAAVVEAIAQVLHLLADLQVGI